LQERKNVNKTCFMQQKFLEIKMYVSKKPKLRLKNRIIDQT